MPPTPRDIPDTAIAQGRRVVETGIGIGKRPRREQHDVEVTAAPRASPPEATGAGAGGAKTGRAMPGTTRTQRAASGSAGRRPRTGATKPSDATKS